MSQSGMTQTFVGAAWTIEATAIIWHEASQERANMAAKERRKRRNAKRALGFQENNT